MYRGRRRDGSVWERVKSWLGYKLHLVVDADYELPVAFKVTRASASDTMVGHELMREMSEQQQGLAERANVLLADRGYDDTALLVKLWDEHKIKPVIDIRNMWKDTDATRLVGDHDNVVHDFRGTVYCHCPQTAMRRRMAYGGFEQQRLTLKYRCPVRHYGVDQCRGEHGCPVRSGIRIPLSEDRRVFTPLAWSSISWNTL